MLRTLVSRGALARPYPACVGGLALCTPRAFSTREEVVNACRLIEKSADEFLEKYVAEDVLWTVTEPAGSSTPISGEKGGRSVLEDMRAC